MKNTKSFEILDSLPTYGPMHMSVTENNESYFSVGFPIRFYKTGKTNWVANFEPGWTKLYGVYEFENKSEIIIIAGGKFYLMNPENEKPIEAFGGGFEALLKTEDGKIILQDQTDLTIIESNGECWHTRRISWDGIKDLNIKENSVFGLSYDPTNKNKEWVEFIVDLESRDVKGGSFY